MKVLVVWRCWSEGVYRSRDKQKTYKWSKAKRKPRMRKMVYEAMESMRTRGMVDGLNNETISRRRRRYILTCNSADITIAAVHTGLVLAFSFTVSDVS